MPEYVLSRDYALRSTRGHMLNFVKGQPTWVPPEVVKEAIAIGAEPVDGERPDVLPPEVVVKEAPSGQEREDLIVEAIREVVTENDSKNFTAAGEPHVKVLEKILGFDIDAGERLAAWRRFKSEEAGA